MMFVVSSHRLLLPVTLIVLLAVLPIVFAQDSPPNGLPLLPPGQHVGIIYSDPEPDADNPLDDVFGATIGAGVDIYELAIDWAALETAPGQIDTSLLEQYLDILNLVGLIPYLNIATIDTVNLMIPDDLLDPDDSTLLAGEMHFDDPIVLGRWGAVLDAVVPVLVAHGGFFLGVGNEVDAWLSAHPDHISGYVQFVVFSRDRVQQMAPELGVGVAIIAGSVLGGEPFVDELLVRSDAAVFTYYPLNGDFSVRDPDAVAEDVERLVEAAGDLPVLFQEAGYPSGYLPVPSNGSSGQMQAQFVRNMFTALAAHPEIRMVSFLQLSDWSDETCDFFLEYYRVDSGAFREYLCSLGFYTYDGQPKPAYTAFLDGLAALRE